MKVFILFLFIYYLNDTNKTTIYKEVINMGNKIKLVYPDIAWMANNVEPRKYAADTYDTLNHASVSFNDKDLSFVFLNCIGILVTKTSNAIHFEETNDFIKDIKKFEKSLDSNIKIFVLVKDTDLPLFKDFVKEALEIDNIVIYADSIVIAGKNLDTTYLAVHRYFLNTVSIYEKHKKEDKWKEVMSCSVDETNEKMKAMLTASISSVKDDAILIPFNSIIMFDGILIKCMYYNNTISIELQEEHQKMS